MATVPAWVSGATAPRTVTAAAPTPSDSFGPLRAAGIGLENFGIVDGHIYRGGQPGKGDYQALAGLGVTTIIDLRLDAKSDARRNAEDAGLRYVNIAIDDHGQPTDSDVTAFLKALDECPAGKVYVHCAGGRHRTGSMIAVYRMVRDGWTLARAYDEMLAYDFYTRMGHAGFKTFVDNYWLRMNADPASVPAAAGVTFR
jgi:protein tyrosine/serine phosphatase